MTLQEQFRQQAPTPLSPRPIQLPTAVEATLKNGLEVVVVPDVRLPLVSYRLALRSGTRTTRGLARVNGSGHGPLSEGTAATVV